MENIAMLPQQIVNGLLAGGVYVVGALGLVLIFGVLDIAHFAHGQMFMLGAYFSYILVAAYNVDFFLSILLAMLAVVIIGFLIERLTYRPLRDQPLLSIAMVSFAVALLVENVGIVAWGGIPKTIPTPYVGKVFNMGSVAVSQQRLIVFVTSVAVIVALQMYLKRTKMGKAIRAMAQRREAAVLVGVDTDRLTILTFALGTALASISGSLLGTIIPIHPLMGMMPTLKGFAIVVLGGMSVLGAVVGGFILGLAENIGAGYISSGYKDSIAFALLVLVLIFKPTGLFGGRA